ncbi:MAG: hypothetical protein H6Q89_4749, partial [Myxococcaceae bacterium]|nr:hypothetical protein [Myxococcaceae bacterium]
MFACGGKTPPGADAGPEDAGLEDAGVVDAGPDLAADELAVLTSSTSAKLGEAWARGELSEDLHALYSFVGHLLPGAIPAQYRGDVADPTGLSQAHVRHAIARRASYTPEQQAMLDAVLARPGTPGFLRINNLEAGGASTCWTRFMPNKGDPAHSGAAADQVIDTKHLRFIPMYPTIGDATDAEKAVLARMRTALESPVANTGDLASQAHFKDYLDAAFEYLLTTHQLADPRGLPDAVANGGLVPVYVFVCDSSTEDAFAVSNFGSLFMSMRLGLEDPALRKVVIPHELTHVFQHNAAPPGLHDAWPVEAFAVAMEHFMSKDVRRWSSVPAPGTTLRSFFMAMN